MKIPDEISFDIISYSSIKGLVFLGNGHESVICNLSTWQSLILPQVKLKRWSRIKSYFGYDPIEKQYKVLSMTSVISTGYCKEYQVLTLGGTGEPSWRKIECPIPHYPCGFYHICINGVLYYPAVHNSSRDLIIICFDVRSEKFKFLKNTYYCYEPLINYNDKLASLQCYQTFYPDKRRINIKLRVLEEAEKEEWSEHTYVLPALCNNFAGDSALRAVGMTQTNEIVLSSSKKSGDYYVFYYNIERNTITMVDIQGMEELKHNNVYTFLDHVEDVKLLKVF